MVTDLVKRYGTVQALDGFTLNVAAGEIVGLVGHNGAGKTTFVEIVSDLIRPDSGHVTIDGKPPSATRGQVGVAPQHIALYPSVTVREHLELFGRLAGLRPSGAERGHRRPRRHPAALGDHGQADREALRRPAAAHPGRDRARAPARPCCCSASRPRAPTWRRGRPCSTWSSSALGEGAAVVYTTHYLPELTELQATIAVAQNGRVIARGTYEDLAKDLPGEVRVTLEDEEEISVSTTEPTATLIELLGRLDRPISSVDVRHPSLGDLYRSLAVHDAC
ncbi:ATP-binding cassette domain-containing protein [Nonomuraea ferruginea]